MARTLSRRPRRHESDYDNYDAAADSDVTDEDDTEEERPRGGRSSRRASSEAEEPRASRRRSSREDDKPRASRRRGNRESEEDRGGRKSGPKRSISRGWGSYEKVKSETSEFAKTFTPDEDEVLIKFLDEEPFAVYREHWIERKGKKSFTCLESFGEDCPICDDLGERAATKTVFNILNFGDGSGAPVVELWETRPQVADLIQNLAKKEKTSPINRDDLYFAVARTGSKGKWTTTILPVKERDLEEDWEVDPLTAEELEEYAEKAYTEDDLYFNTRAQLEEIVEEQLDD